jgi:hypothetical protein
VIGELNDYDRQVAVFIIEAGIAITILPFLTWWIFIQNLRAFIDPTTPG